MQIATAYNMARQLVDFSTEESKNSKFHIVTHGSHTFDVGEFQRSILKAIENIMFFAQHPIIRSLRVESNRAK